MDDSKSNVYLFIRSMESIPKSPQKEKHVCKHDHTFRTISTIFRLSSWLGITFSDSPRKRWYHCSSPWDCLIQVSVFVTYFFVMCGLFVFEIDQRIAYTFYAYLTLGLLIRVSVLMKKKRMCLVASCVCYWCNHLNVDGQKHLKWMKVQMFIFLILLAIVAVVLSVYSNTVPTVASDHWIIFGQDVEVGKIPVLVYVIRISLIYSSVTSTGMIFIALILCCNSYNMAANMIQAFGRCFSKEVVVDGLSKQILLSRIHTYRNMISSFRDIDGVVSSSCFLLYAASVTSFFNSVSISFSEATEVDSILIVQVVISFLMAIVIFFSLTITGTSATSRYESLKLILVEGAEGMFAVSKDPQVLTTYKFLTDTVNGNRVYFTGAYMFEINMGLILTTAGAMVTYGVIIFS